MVHPCEWMLAMPDVTRIWAGNASIFLSLSLSMCIYIYIYTYKHINACYYYYSYWRIGCYTLRHFWRSIVRQIIKINTLLIIHNNILQADYDYYYLLLLQQAQFPLRGPVVPARRGHVQRQHGALHRAWGKVLLVSLLLISLLLSLLQYIYIHMLYIYMCIYVHHIYVYIYIMHV